MRLIVFNICNHPHQKIYLRQKIHASIGALHSRPGPKGKSPEK
jgi:hypothetical protein